MTTITLEKSSNLKETHFYDVDALMRALLQSEFEAHLDTRYEIVKNAPKTDFVTL